MIITEEKLVKIRGSDMDLEHYLVLYSKYHKLGWLTTYKVREIIYKHLENLGYLSSSTRSLLAAGKHLIEQIDADTLKDKEEYENDFNEFWEGWPTNDQCLHFPASGRYMRGNKHDAFVAYKNLRNIGKEHSSIILARDNHIETLIKDSMRTNQNKLKYLPNPAKWLNNGIWEAWVVKEQPKLNKQINVT